MSDRRNRDIGLKRVRHLHDPDYPLELPRREKSADVAAREEIKEYMMCLEHKKQE